MARMSPLFRKPSINEFFSDRFSRMSKLDSRYRQLAVRRVCSRSLLGGMMVKLGKESTSLSSLMILLLSLKLSDLMYCSYFSFFY
jgi:pantoate kinase